MGAKGLTIVGSAGTKRFIKRLRATSGTVTGASRAAASVVVISTVTVAGAKVGDVAVCSPNVAQPDTLGFECRVTAADTVKIYAVNPTAGGISDTTSTWNVVVTRDL